MWARGIISDFSFETVFHCIYMSSHFEKSCKLLNIHLVQLVIGENVEKVANLWPKLCRKLFAKHVLAILPHGKSWNFTTFVQFACGKFIHKKFPRKQKTVGKWPKNMKMFSNSFFLCQFFAICSTPLEMKKKCAAMLFFASWNVPMKNEWNERMMMMHEFTNTFKCDFL